MKLGGRLVPRLVLAVSLMLATVGYVLHTQVPGGPSPVSRLDPAQTALNLAWLSYGVLGVVILGRQPRHPIGWILLGVGAAESIGDLASGYAAYTLAEDPDDPTGVLGVWLIGSAWVPALLAPAVFLPMLFPDGRLPSSRWRPWAWAAALLVAVTWVGFMFAEGPLADAPELDNPLGVPGLGALRAGILLSPAVVVLGLAAVVVRRRRAIGDAREQLRWLVYAVCVTVVVTLALPFLGSWGPLPALVTFASVALLPVAITIAITRFHLYDIDLIVNRTLVYGGLTAAVLAAYAVAVLAAGRFLGTDLAWRESVLVTAAIAIAAYPVRGWLQRLVNRLMYGDRDDPYAAMSKLARRLSESVTPATLLPTVAQTVAQALRLPYVAIRLRPEPDAPSASYGTLRSEPHRIPLVHQGEPVGTLELGSRGPHERFSTADLRLLDDVACQAAVAAHALRLAQDLQLAREQLVRAREEERRRLRRDLHDGLGSALAGLALQAGNARRELARTDGGRDLDEAARWLATIEKRAVEAVADVRRVVNDLRPPALDELGLAGVLRAYADGLPVDVRVEVPERLPALSAAVEVAAYRIAVEAMTNAARHGHPTRCLVAIGLDGGLTLDVVDDGEGFTAPPRNGVGLDSMRERAAEIGGTCVVISTPGRGTTVRAVLPVIEGPGS
jgi:signal transduction histidine kinase